MPLEDDIQQIRDFLLKRYKNNLAGILIFGSANTQQFAEGKSDIDHMIFLKEQKGINFEEEINFLFNSLKQHHFAAQYFNTLEGIKDYIQRRKSFSTYITIVTKDGSRVIYSTPEFERTKKYLIEHPLTKEEIKDQIKEKDRFELDGYFKEISEFNLTKALMAHLRRKLQIINYFRTGKLIFDYEKCLNNADSDKEEKGQLESLYENYKKRKKLSQGEIDYYFNLAKKFTKKITLL